MVSGARRLMVCLVLCCVAGLAVSPVTALGEGSSSEAAPPGEGSGASSGLGGALVTPGSPTQGEQAQAAEGAKLANPNAVAEREASQTKFEGLNTEQAANVASEAFPAVIDEPAGWPPKLPAGQSITAYPSDRAAQVDLGGGKYGVIESLAPIAVEASPGQRVPVDLGLTEAGGGFEPKTPVVGVRIPKRLGEGVALASTGVSLTPVSEQGSPLGGSEGTLDGAAVFYANTQTDTDAMMKPTTWGFEADTVLRSIDSPQQLFFRVGLPAGASLEQAKDGSGAVDVVAEGATLATIAPPFATDAQGTPVPVSMSSSGDMLTLTVEHQLSEYAMPVVVDPTVEDKLGPAGHQKETNWVFNPYPGTSSFYNGSEEQDTLTAAEQHMEMLYQTKGESRIYELEMESTSEIEHAHSTLELVDGSTEENGELLGNNINYVTNKSVLCGKKGESPPCGTSGPNTNFARFQQTANQAGTTPWSTITSADVHIYQEKLPEPGFNTTSPTIEYKGTEGEIIKRENVLYPSSKGWLGPHSNTAFEVVAKDPGIGVSLVSLQDLKIGATWLRPYEEGHCEGVQCPETVKEPYTYNSEMENGDSGVRLSVKNETGATESIYSGAFRVDAAPPHNLSLAGLPATGMIDEGQLHLQGKATDGTAPTPSSGIKVLRLGLDGYTILGGKSGTCTPGPCTASGEWTLNVESIGAGKHTLELVAEDNAENIETKKYTITVRHAGLLSVAPGSVNPLTGALHLGANDVSLSGGRGSLGISRSYNSRELTRGEQGPLGPQWKLTVSGSQEVEQEPSGNVVMVNSSGARVNFESNGKGGFISPKGDENLVLEAEKEGEKVKAYLLKDPAAGTTVKYIQPGGVGPWVVADSEGVLSKTNGEKETVEWERLENVTRPRLALAPVAGGVTCSTTVKEPKELSKGCRALSFTYATETTATGEAPSQWKAYKGRLMTVSFTAYNPSTKAMETKPVAEYAYDKQGRLRAEWDPQISPALKTTYGYDAEGHVTAVNPPGQEPALFHYGTTSKDPSPGRLLSVTRLPAGTSTQVKEQDEKAAPVNEAVPTLSSTSPVIGTTLSISSNGTWSNSPLTYSDAWEDCYTNESKETCTPIPGAVNSSYTPQPRDAGYTLRAQVTAVNSDGAAVATTAASKALAAVAPAYHSQFGKVGEAEGQFKGPAGDAIDPGGDVWVVDSSNARVQELSASGTFMKAIGWGVSNGESRLEVCASECKAGLAGSGAGQFSKPEGIAINQTTKNVYVLDRGNNRIEEFNDEGKYVGTFGTQGSEPGQLNAPEGIAVVPAGVTTSATSGEVWVGDSGNDRVDEFTEKGEYLGSLGSEGSGAGQFKGPHGIAFSGEDAYVVDSGNDRVQEFSMSGEFIRKFGSKGTGEGEFETPNGIATEPVSGDLYVADTGNNRIAEFNSDGTYLLAYGKKGEGEKGEFSSPDGLAVNAAGDIYVADTANNRVQELEPKYVLNTSAPEPPALGTSSVTTIDYNVPLSGPEGSYLPNLTKEAVEKWGQTDDPAEPVPGESLATAVFPPDEPMGWPAKDYKRATITYMDELGHTVNRASPSGGISTSEYNEDNEVIRSLSADNRAAALKETCESKTKCKSAEVSELLDTKSKYNGETKEEKEAEEKTKDVEPGTRLLEVRGPQHTVKLSTGSEVKARAHVKYYYDEGAPEGERYDLVTMTTDGAEYEGKEADVRTTTTSYSGQGNLGWLLRKPTSVTTEPSGLKLVRTTLYNRQTGSVTETRAPAAGAGSGFGAYTYSSQLTTAGILSIGDPGGVAVDKEGHVWVADSANDRVDEFSSTGEDLNRFGTAGTGDGEFNDPRGIAVDSEGHIWVADTGNNRVEEVSSTGAFIRAFSAGTSPSAITIDSSGNVWVADPETERVEEFSSTGTYLREDTGIEGPEGIAANAKGDVWVSTDEEVVELSSTATKIGSFGSWGKGNGQFERTRGVAISGEAAYVVDYGNSRVEEFKLTEKEGKSSGEYVTQFGTKGTGNGQFKEPWGIALDKEGHVWVADAGNNRIQEFNATGVYTRQLTTAGVLSIGDPGGVAVDKEGDVWVADSTNDRVDEFSNTGEYLNRFGTAGSGEEEFNDPRGIAVDSEGHIWVADTGNDRVEELSSTGTFIRAFGSRGLKAGEFEDPVALAIDSSGNVWVADSENERVEEFSSTGTYLREYTEIEEPEGIAANAKGDVWVSAYDEVVELSSTATKIGSFGSDGKGNGQFESARGVTISGEAAYVVDYGNSRVEEFKLTEKEGKSKGEYVAQFGSKGTGNGQFKDPQGIALDSEGHVWVADAGNNRIQEFSLPASPHAAQTIYYSAGPSSTYHACGEHPEWANLPCRSQPALQPAKGDPLPVATDTYNIWDEPETVTEEFGSTTTRTKKMTYDAAGRALTNEETTTGSSDTAVPKATSEYSSETGVMIKQSTTVGETTKSIKSVYSTLGQLTEYTDADGNTTQYFYSGPANDGQIEEVKYGDNRGSQMYSYNPTSKALEKLLDVGPEGGAGAGTFTAGYDVEGKLTSETYPNGMTATYTFNPAGEAAGIEYEKRAHCAGTCPEAWFKETVVSSIHGEELVRTSTLAKEEYTYDEAGRLIKVNETPTGKGCKTRNYTYNEDSDRTSETTRESATETCATTGGTKEEHTYDEADRLIDTGVEYEALGNQTKVPAADAGEHEITASFYADNQVAIQKQNGETTNYSYDPAGRTEKTVSEGSTKATVINHYPGPGEAISWACEEAAKECEEGKGTKWTRNIPGIDGSLTATQHDSEAAVLQLHDLEGNVVATAAVSETETKLLTSYNPTEFGVPVNGTPPTKYSWLGASGYTPEQSSGAANPGGSTYVPQLGAPLQTEPVTPPGAIPNGLGSSAAFVAEVSATEIASGNEAAKRHAEEGAAEEKAAELQAQEKILQQCREEGGCGAEPQGGGDPCTTAFESEKEYDPLGEEVISAWATIEWCYGGGKVLSAHLKKGSYGHHQYSPPWVPGYSMSFSHWESTAMFVGEVYVIHEIAVFQYGVPYLLGLASPVPIPTYYLYLELDFELYGDGKAETSVGYRCEPICA
jgi:sugar lactone lactonase YvrE